jgi:23S rRNA (adenine-N6)-dimethyltransferase
VAERRARGAAPACCAPDQHFLRSSRLAAAVVADACIEATDLVLDIGAGRGRLTIPLAQCAREVHAIEVDPLLAEQLRKRFRGHQKVTVIEDDALRMRLPNEEFRVVANIPFGCTGAILRRLLDDPSVPLVRADLIVEWGVALKRTACWPSTMLNVSRGVIYEFLITRRLPARCFEPAPRVDAAVLSIRRRPVPLVPPSECELFRAFVASGFRLGVRRAMAADMPRRDFARITDELGVARTAAARELDLHQWVELHRAIRAMR